MHENTILLVENPPKNAQNWPKTSIFLDQSKKSVLYTEGQGFPGSLCRGPQKKHCEQRIQLNHRLLNLDS